MCIAESILKRHLKTLGAHKLQNISILVSSMSGISAEMKQNKKKKPMEYTINFTHFGCSKFHIEKIIGKDKLVKYFQKENKSAAKAKVVINQEKPAIMSYKLSTGPLTLSVNYEVENCYRMVCSFFLKKVFFYFSKTIS